MGEALSPDPAARRTGQGYGRDFWLYAAGQAVSIAGDRIAAITFVFLVLELSGSFAPALALFFVARVLPTLAAGLVVGVIADQMDRKRLMIACDVVRGLLVCLTPLAVALGLWTVYPIVVLLYGLNLVFTTSARAALPDVVPESRMMGANSVLFSLQTAADVAYALGGYLVYALGVRAPFFVDGATFGFSAIMIALMRLPARDAVRVANVGGFLARIRSGVAYLFTNTFLKLSTIAYTFVSLAVGAGFVITPIYATDVLAHSPGLTGPLTSGAFRFAMIEVGLGVGAFIGSALTGRLASRWPGGRMFAAGFTLAGIFQMLLAFTNNLYVATALLTLTGFATSFSIISALTLLQTLTPTDLRGRVVAGRTTIIQGSWAVGSALAGLALLELSSQPLWVIDGALFVLGSLFVWLNREARSQP
jgi:MFS family permease